MKGDEERLDATPADDALVEGEAQDDRVLFYLLFLCVLLIGSVVLGFFVVVQYGLVVLVAASAAGLALALVAAVVSSVVTGDAKLSKAQSKMHRWHATCRTEVAKEVKNFKEDMIAHKAGHLPALTFGNPGFEFEEIREPAAQGRSMGSPNNPRQTTGQKNNAAQRSPGRKSGVAHQQRKAKSLTYRAAVAPLAKAKRKQNHKSQKTRSGRALKTGRKEGIEMSNYRPPNVV